ncbi:2427_t:CDS:2, partial [Cetraspora pellucida]
DDILSSIVLHLPFFVNKSSEITSPINFILYHTYPNILGELVNNNLNQNQMTHSSIKPLNTPVSPLCTPSKELCKQLVNDYFTNFNVFTPIVNRQKFSIQQNYHNKENFEMLMCAILAVASTRYSDDPSIQKTQNKPAGVFFDAAKKLLDTKYNNPSLETVQTLLLLAHAEASITRIHSESMFFGMAVQMAHILRLERNDPTLPPDENEERRRIFYLVYCSERWSSFIFGRPVVIDDININVPLPALSSFGTSTRQFFLAWIKLSRILGQIWNFGYSSQSLASRESWLFHANDQKITLRQIRLELTKWLRELPEELRCQYLSNADSSRTNLSDFSIFAGQDGPVQMCLTAVTTIAQISRKIQNYDQKAFNDFRLPTYGICESIILELVIINGAQ